MLTGAHRAFHHRIDDFQMRRVERQRHMQVASGRGNICGKSLVIFHVAGSQIFGVDTFKFGEQHARLFAQNIDQHIQPPAMRHADHRFLHTLCATALQ